MLPGSLIAIDFDDVLSQTNAAATKWHNRVYGTRMTLDDFYYYHWWQNPGWGNPSQVITKAQMFYTSIEFLQVEPVPGATEALQALKDMRFRLTVITTRTVDLREQTAAWIKKWLPDVFEGIHFAGDFSTYDKNSEQVDMKKLSKGEICQKLSASLLIDDSVENVLGCVAAHGRKTPALLFGDYEWGKRASTVKTLEDMMSFDERQNHEMAVGLGAEWWKKDSVNLPEGVWKVKDWPAVLVWLQGDGKDVVNNRNA